MFFLIRQVLRALLSKKSKAVFFYKLKLNVAFLIRTVSRSPLSFLDFDKFVKSHIYVTLDSLDTRSPYVAENND